MNNAEEHNSHMKLGNFLPGKKTNTRGFYSSWLRKNVCVYVCVFFKISIYIYRYIYLQKLPWFVSFDLQVWVACNHDDLHLFIYWFCYAPWDLGNAARRCMHWNIFPSHLISLCLYVSCLKLLFSSLFKVTFWFAKWRSSLVTLKRSLSGGNRFFFWRTWLLMPNIATVGGCFKHVLFLPRSLWRWSNFWRSHILFKWLVSNQPPSLALPPTQDASRHQDYSIFSRGIPVTVNLHLWLESWVGGRPKVFHLVHPSPSLGSEAPSLLSPRVFGKDLGGGWVVSVWRDRRDRQWQPTKKGVTLRGVDKFPWYLLHMTDDVVGILSNWHVFCLWLILI